MKFAFPGGWKPSFGGGAAASALSASGKEERRTWLLVVGYVGFFIACFVLAAYFTFPYERLRDIIIQRFAIEPANGVGPKTTVHIEKLSPHWLTGIQLEGVQIERSEGDAKPSKITIDELTINVSPIALAFDNYDATFSVEAGEGTLEGSYESDKEGKARHVIAELDAFELGDLGPLIYDQLGVPLAGKATGTFDLNLTEEASAATGEIDMKVEDFTLGDGKQKVKMPGVVGGGLTVNPINAGALELKITIKEGVASIEKLEAKGKDAELTGSGSLRLSYPMSRSRVDVTVGFKLLDAFKKKNDKNAVAVEMLTNNPIVQRATGADGMARFQLSGVLTSLKPRPAAPGAGTAAPRKRDNKAKKKKAAEAAEPAAEEPAADEAEEP